MRMAAKRDQAVHATVPACLRASRRRGPQPASSKANTRGCPPVSHPALPLACRPQVTRLIVAVVHAAGLRVSRGLHDPQDDLRRDVACTQEGGGHRVGPAAAQQGGRARHAGARAAGAQAAAWPPGITWRAAHGLHTIQAAVQLLGKPARGRRFHTRPREGEPRAPGWSAGDPRQQWRAALCPAAPPAPPAPQQQQQPHPKSASLMLRMSPGSTRSRLSSLRSRCTTPLQPAMVVPCPVPQVTPASHDGTLPAASASTRQCRQCPQTSPGWCDGSPARGRAARQACRLPSGGASRAHLECRYWSASISWRKMVRASASL